MGDDSTSRNNFDYRKVSIAEGVDVECRLDEDLVDGRCCKRPKSGFGATVDSFVAVGAGGARDDGSLGYGQVVPEIRCVEDSITKVV